MQAWGETKHGSQQCCYDWPKSHYGWKTLAYWHQRYLCQTETLLLNLCLHLPCNDTVKQQATSRQSCYNNFAPLNFELSPRTPREGSFFLLGGWRWSQVFCSRCQTAHKKLCCSAHGIWLQFHEAWGRPIHTYMCFFPSPRIWNAITGFLAWQRFHTVTFGLETWRPLLEVKHFFLFFLSNWGATIYAMSAMHLPKIGTLAVVTWARTLHGETLYQCIMRRTPHPGRTFMVFTRSEPYGIVSWLKLFCVCLCVLFQLVHGMWE